MPYNFGTSQARQYVRTVSDLFVSKIKDPHPNEEHELISQNNTASNQQPTPESRRLSLEIANTWDCWIQRSHYSAAAANGEWIGVTIYDTISTTLNADEQFSVKQHFVTTAWEGLNSSNPVEGKLSEGLLKGFQSRSKSRGDCTNYGYASFLLQPTYIQSYFQHLSAVNKTKDEESVKEVIAMEIKWMEMATNESESIAAGRYFGSIMYANSCTPEFKAERQWFVESSFPGKVSACKKAGLAKYSNNSMAIERVLNFYQNVLNTFQVLVKRG